MGCRIWLLNRDQKEATLIDRQEQLTHRPCMNVIPLSLLRKMAYQLASLWSLAAQQEQLTSGPDDLLPAHTVPALTDG